MAEKAEPQKLVELETLPDPEAGVQPSEAGAPPPRPPPAGVLCFLIDAALRVLLFASALTAVLVMVTANQTKSATPGFQAPPEAKFDNSPALVYFVTALSVACLYSIISVLVSISVILAPIYAKGFLPFFVICDVVILGVIASATGAASTVGYIGLHGNSHVNWGKVCNVYDTFCQHIGAASAISLFAAVILVVLVALSVVNLHKKIRK